MNKLIFPSLALLALGMAACDDPADELTRRKNHPLGDDDDSVETANADPTKPGACETGAAHIGFAKTDFVADRKPGGLGENRRRVKPYSAMQTEFSRVLGVAPATLAQSSAAFGDIPARWYLEPTAGAVSLYTTYTLAFSACYASLSDSPAFDCATLQRKAWQRSPTPAETQACTDFMNGLTSETPRRRASHACASILTSAGFTTY